MIIVRIFICLLLFMSLSNAGSFESQKNFAYLTNLMFFVCCLSNYINLYIDEDKDKLNSFKIYITFIGVVIFNVFVFPAIMYLEGLRPIMYIDVFYIAVMLSIIFLNLSIVALTFKMEKLIKLKSNKESIELNQKVGY